METFSALLTFCEGNPPVTHGFSLQRPVSFDDFFDLRLNKRLKGNSHPAPKPYGRTSTSYHHLIGLAEIYLSEHDHQIASKSNLAGFPMVTPDTRCGV